MATISEKGLRALLRGLAKLVHDTVKKDPLFAEEVRQLVNDHTAEPKEEKPERPDKELQPGQLLVRRVQQFYERAGAEEVPEPGVILGWSKRLGGKEKLREALVRMREEQYLVMPVAYQMKVMNSWVKRGGPPPPKKARSRIGTHASAGAGEGDRDAIRRKLGGGDQ